MCGCGRQTPRRSCVDVFPGNCGHPSCSVHFVIGGWWSGSGECSSSPCRSSLGELGGLPPDDQTTTPSHCNARLMVQHLEAHEPVGCFLSVVQCQRQLTDAGLVIPSWEELANTPPERLEEPEPSQPKVGWQQQASRKLEDTFIHNEVPALTDSARALFRSQHGPLASSPLTALPTSTATRLDPQPFRPLLCRRLHLPLLLSMRTCRCGRQHDIFGHHRAACAVAGFLGKRGYPLECAAAQVCREAGARVSTNVPVRDLDLVAHNNLDGRRLEVIADGLTLCHGAQLAVDTTLVSPLRRDGSARARAA